MNREGVPGPLGRTWGDTSIRGHVSRGTGIINNELYAGVLVWNRLRFVKDPSTGKRVSRLNPESAWIRTEVPHLRIVDDECGTRCGPARSRYRPSSGRTRPAAAKNA
ncbi:recombinase family protein [Phyllobacterium salinisoli]|uniref:recombinase family protein n=1 Tax=Phyllobacterium salinisoli TaxID=1899321 RepID=UPI001FDFAD5A|nr:recombinase family protein [Phyllobacterium salinisoli]